MDGWMVVGLDELMTGLRTEGLPTTYKNEKIEAVSEKDHYNMFQK